ncbi:MAG: hypothetical protein DRP81_06885 [Candidatus Omnitrophota bacterium]|nr:MAG: hypothetical protein DRP81_06885 [Candidatus Omnitrophota bacterium]
MEENKLSRLSVLLHSLLGFFIGFFSNSIALTITKIGAIFFGFVIVILFGFVLERFTGKKGFKWWLGNGLLFYLFLWFITWTFFYNI